MTKSGQDCAMLSWPLFLLAKAVGAANIRAQIAAHGL
jgi:hypothetical protein